MIAYLVTLGNESHPKTVDYSPIWLRGHYIKNSYFRQQIAAPFRLRSHDNGIVFINIFGWCGANTERINQDERHDPPNGDQNEE